jgi:MoaD family protein
MARVSVKTFSVVRDAIGKGVVEIDVENPETVSGLFDVMIRKYGMPFKEKIWDPDTGEISPFLIRLNDEVIRSTVDLDRKINDGDKISLIIPVGGG